MGRGEVRGQVPRPVEQVEEAAVGVEQGQVARTRALRDGALGDPAGWREGRRWAEVRVWKEESRVRGGAFRSGAFRQCSAFVCEEPCSVCGIETEKE